MVGASHPGGGECWALAQPRACSPRPATAPLRSLHFLLEKHFAKAVQIVDQGGVFCFVGEQSGRKAYQVQGQSSSDRYTVYPWHYCSCQAFFYDVVSKQEAHFVSGAGRLRP